VKLNWLPYLLFILLPTQLGKYFFLPAAYISGLRSDYLAISFYLTDIISALIILGYFLRVNRHPELVSGSVLIKMLKRVQHDKHLSFSPFLFFSLSLFLYLFLSSLFISVNPIISLFKLLKLLEIGLLCFVLIRLRPDISKIILSISIGAFYSSVLAILQFIKGGSLNGLWWFLGERTFTVTTPGIAAFSLNGMRFLRPYAAFPHPNVLAGFLAISSLSIIWYLRYKKPLSKKVFYYFAGVLVFGLIALILTASRNAIFAYAIGILLLLKPVKFDGKSVIAFFTCVLISIFIPLFISIPNESILERKALIKKSFDIIQSSGVLGVGLNGFIQIPNNTMHFMGVGAYQPVHNVFLLILAETGMVGVFLFLVIVHLIFCDYKLSFVSFSPVLFSLFLLSLFDHYLFTLQEGMLITVSVISLAFLARKKYT